MDNVECAISIVEMEGFTINDHQKELIKKLLEKESNYDDFIQSLKNNKKEVNDNE